MTSQEYHSRAGTLLQGSRAFYLQSGKGTAKEYIKLSKGFPRKSLGLYIFEEYLIKYLK